MPTDILLEYLIDSISSMPVYLDENVLTELEDSWRWRHTSPGFFTDDDEDEFILDWTRDALAEPDVLGVVDSEFNQKLALAIKSETFLFNIRATQCHRDSRSLPKNALFGLEYVLRSGKLGDPQDFLDTNILPCLDAARILYNDWTILKERETTRIAQLSLSPSKTFMPLSNVTNNHNSPAKRRISHAVISVPTKKRNRDSKSTGSSIVLMTNSSRKNLTARRRTYSINLHVDKEPFFDKEMMTRGVSFMPPVMKESDIQQLMKILEETVEHVEEPEKSASGPNFQNYAVPSNVSPDLRSSILSESVSLPANCFLPEI
ncbi:MAG: hypothetical protein NXY57DRAFT_1024156 [Lentinula lateritia]|uniref:Uncharacterized protein n=1 Tax=Lentinula lateritia TaxID=40482 RepID=A0ABQ8VQ68_9AGAR|nr:MAG: hypothetical protein NXY57DRAFT_1024156 [Lentinula lateritia]KAJ4498543.1 hypothetical protein C8R41DRAFT_818337 [Lentinula lateritia]